MPSYAYLIPYANQHAFENRMLSDASALERFITALPKSLDEDLRTTLLDHYMAARARANQGLVAMPRDTAQANPFT
jgi:hypothetical protein